MAKMVCRRKLTKKLQYGKESEEPWKIFEGSSDDEMFFLPKVEKKYSGSRTRVCGKGSWRIHNTAPKRAYGSQNGLLGVRRDMPCSKKRTRDICKSAPSSKRPALIQTIDMVILALPCKVPVLEKTMVNTRSTTNNKCSGKPTVKRSLLSDNPVQDIPAACPQQDGDQCASGVPSISQTDDQDQLDQDLPYGVEDLMYLDTPEFLIECANFCATAGDDVDHMQEEDDLHKFLGNFGL